MVWQLIALSWQLQLYPQSDSSSTQEEYYVQCICVSPSTNVCNTLHGQIKGTYLIFSCLCSVHYLYNALWLGKKCVLQKIIV